MQKITYFALCIDESGSMSGLATQALAGVNSTIETIKKRAREEGQLAVIMVVAFNTNPRLILKPTDCHDVELIRASEYRPNGGTALFDAVEYAVKQFQPHVNNPSLDSSFVIMSQTDGEENSSISMNARKLKELMERLENTDRWTFTYQLPRGYGQRFIRQFGISEHNVMEWETNSKGAAAASQVQSQAVSEFFTARTNGATRSSKFYHMTTDLSSLSKSDVIGALDNVSDQYKLINVNVTAAIRPFVEDRTKKAFVIGSVYYELTKPEEIQPQKQVLLVEKRTGNIFGGQAARDLIGLPRNTYAKVKPGAHGDYDIYVQSTSVNRKLVQGQRILLKY